MKIFKAIHKNAFYDLQNGIYKHDTVSVFCGFDGYQNNVAAINELAGVVAAEYPDIPLEHMTVHQISETQSRRYAHMMAIIVSRSTEEVL